MEKIKRTASGAIDLRKEIIESPLERWQRIIQKNPVKYGLLKNNYRVIGLFREGMTYNFWHNPKTEKIKKVEVVDDLTIKTVTVAIVISR